MEGTTLMAKKEKTPQELFAEEFVSKLHPQTVKDVEDGLKSILGPIFESMLNGEMSAHLGYGPNDHGPKSTTTAAMVQPGKHSNLLSAKFRLTHPGIGMQLLIHS